MAQPVLTGLFWWCIKGCSDRKQGAYKTNRIRCKFAHFSTWTWSWTHLVCGDLWGDYLHIMRVNNYDFAHTRLSSISRENLLPYIALQIIISCKRFKKNKKNTSWCLSPAGSFSTWRRDISFLVQQTLESTEKNTFI